MQEKYNNYRFFFLFFPPSSILFCSSQGIQRVSSYPPGWIAFLRRRKQRRGGTSNPAIRFRRYSKGHQSHCEYTLAKKETSLRNAHFWRNKENWELPTYRFAHHFHDMTDIHDMNQKKKKDFHIKAPHTHNILYIIGSLLHLLQSLDFLMQKKGYFLNQILYFTSHNKGYVFLQLFSPFPPNQGRRFDL